MDMEQLTVIFCRIDDFCKEYQQYVDGKLLPNPLPTKSRGPDCCLSDSEIMTILVAFQAVGYRNFKTFYTGFLRPLLGQCFSSITELSAIY